MAQLHPEAEGLRLRLDVSEVDVLSSLARGLALRLDGALGGGEEDPVVARLAPTVSRSDAELDSEVRAMLRGDLLTDRVVRLEAFASDLRGWQDRQDGDVDHVLDPDTALRLIEALNDLRIALATTIGLVGPEGVDGRSVPADDRQDARRLMDALAWLQGGLIEFVDGED